MEIIPIRLRLSNAYLIKNKRAILVDTGSPGEASTIQKALARADVTLTNLALILLTHGHSDHAGGAHELQQRSGAPVAIHPADAEMLTTGKNRTLRPTKFEATLVRPFVDRPFAPLQPDWLIEDEVELTAYGIDGRVLFTPGHTRGSISLALANSQVIIGDLLMGGYMGGQIAPNVPKLHYFAEDSHAIEQSLQRVLAFATKQLYVGHGGPLEAQQVIRQLPRISARLRHVAAAATSSTACPTIAARKDRLA